MFKKLYNKKGCRRFLALLMAGILTMSGVDMLTASASETSEVVSDESGALQGNDNQDAANDVTSVSDPTENPDTDLTTDPTENPVTDPTAAPTEEPAADPTAAPTEGPAADPTVAPTEEPAVDPTVAPTENPPTDSATTPTTELNTVIPSTVQQPDIKVKEPVSGGALPLDGALLTLNAVDPNAGIATVAEEGAYVLNATELSATDVADNSAITRDSKIGSENYFTIRDTVKQRTKSGATTSIEIASASTKGAIEFTVTENYSATAEIVFSSTGGSNTSDIALYKGTGAVALESGETVTKVTGTGKTTIEYSNLESGVYQIKTPNADGTCGRAVRIYSITVTEEAVGVIPDITVSPIVQGLPDGMTLVLKKDGSETTVTSGTDVTLSGQTAYEMAVKNSDGTENSDYIVTVDKKTTYKTGAENESVTFVVASSYVNPTVKLAEGSLPLADGNSITLKAKSGDISLTVGSTAKLTIYETYTLETAEGSKTKATVGGKTEFTVAADMSSLEIMLEATVVNVPVKINSTDPGLTAQVTALTLTSTGGTVDLLQASSSNSTVELNIGEEYTLSCTGLGSDVTYAVNSENSTKVKITSDTDRITVVLTKKVEGLNIIDLTQGLVAGETYPGGISVLDDMPYTASGGTVQGKNNPKVGGASGTGAKDGVVPDYGAVLVLNAEQDGRLKIGLRSAGGKDIYFVDGEEGQKDTFKSSADSLITYKVEAGHTYYFYGNGTKIKMDSIVVDYRPAGDWALVSAPVLGTPVASNPGSAKEGTISIPYNAMIGGVYSDSMDIRVMQNGAVIDVITVVDETSIADDYQGTAEYTPAASGDYTFVALLKRSGEQAKTSNEATVNGFILPMAAPVIVNTEDLGSGSVKFSWQEVTEAASYNVYLDGALAGSTEKPYYRFTGLASGKEYTFAVEAVGNGDISDKSSQKMLVTGEAKKNWKFSAFGQGVSTKASECGYEGSFETGDLKLWNVGNKGKLVPASTDGLVFYYTTIDPETENFTLTADVVVDSWAYTNGQEGFGMMAADNVGVHGDSSIFWNNSYMLSVTKVEYCWDPELLVVSDAGTKYTMRLGIGAQEKTGVTPENLPSMEDGSGINNFITNMYTLESSAAQTPANDGVNEFLPSGSYNIVGNYTNETLDYPTTSAGLQTTFHMVLQRNNTGYFLSYTDQNGVTTTKKFYHGDEGDELAKLDSNNIYVGFFASRSASISVQNATLTTIAPENDAPAEERPISYVTPKVGFESAKVANSTSYELVYYGNADGKLYIECEGGDLIADFVDVKADTKYRFNTQLRNGTTVFKGYFQPDTGYKPSKYAELSSYEPIEFSIKVEYKESRRNVYYVSPENRYWGTGAKDNPIDLLSAIKVVAPGDTIVLMEGTYSLDRTIVIERGVSGREGAMIYMIADPEAASRPVLDFNKACAGMIMAGDYWYFQGFDVTRSSAGDKGIQVSGSHNTLDNLRTYRNGNTGIQISRYKGTDLWDEWPSYNLILNCTSFLNADPGYEDADGFAAKLTIGDGNVFDGCIAAYNADDGWDLFAKIESGPIGRVVIKNSVAFKNGYDIGEDGNEIDAGNGNGFKMGGSSITGYHTLINSVAFGNKSKGIDSNSCPDIQVYNSISFNNEANNVAFYTNDAKNTDFFADGIISYKTADIEGKDPAKSYSTGENFKLLGSQDESKVRGRTNYYWSGGKSTNTSKVAVADDWFVNMDMDAAIHGGICRNADGTINMNGFLQLTDAAPADAGARLVGAGKASEVVVPTLVRWDDGDDSSGGGAGSGAAGGAGQLIAEVNWDTVAGNIGTAAKSKTQQNIDVLSGDRFEVPTSVLNKLAGENVTLALHAGDSLVFSINGKDIKKADAPFKMTLSHASVIPANVADQVLANALVSKVFSMEDKGVYPFHMNVHANLGAENAGKMAYLYYYDEKSGSMKLSGSFRITANGQAMFALYRGDEYIITVANGPAAISGQYVVVKGDTLSSIAKKTGVSLNRLVAVNPRIKNINMIHPGQAIELP